MASSARQDRDEQRQRLRQDRLRALREDLTNAEAQLTEPTHWRAFIELAARFPQGEYSVSNLLLIAQQHPGASALADYESWRALGRQVSKGQRGIAIVALDRDGQNTPAYVFDTSQTHPLHDDGTTATPPAPPTAQARAAPGGAGALDAALQSLAARREVTLPHDKADHAQRTTALTRHALHGRSGNNLDAEAHSAAHLVLRAHGLAGPRYTGPTPASDPFYDPGLAAERVATTAWQILAPTHAPARDQAAARLQHAHGHASRAVSSALAAHAETTAARATRPRSVGRTPRELGQVGEADLIPNAGTLDRLAALNDAAAEFYRAQLDGAEAARGYLRDRVGDGAHLPRGFVLGYAPPHWTALLDHLRQQGHSDQALLDAGLVQQARSGRLIDRFRDRVLIGLHDEAGRLAGFIGRPPHENFDPEYTPKYLNTPATELFDKGRVLCGLHEQRDTLTSGAVPVLMEGPFDVLATAATPGAHGQLAPVAPSGTAFTPQQAAALADACHANRMVLAHDGDTSGQAATLRAAEQLLPLPVEVRTTTLPEGHDPASWARSQPPRQVLAAYLDDTQSRPALSALVDARIDSHGDRLASVDGQVDAMRHAVTLLHGQPAERVTREALRIATRLDMDPVTVAEELGEVPKSDRAAARRTTARATDLATDLASRAHTEGTRAHPAALARMASPPAHPTPEGTSSRAARAAPSPRPRGTSDERGR